MHTRSKTAGFTLVEVIVSIGIFSMAAFMISSGLLVLMDSQVRLADKQQVFDEFRIAAEFMEREITIGYLFHQPQPDTLPAEYRCDILNGCLEFTVRSRPDLQPLRVSYRYDATNKRLLRAEQRSYGPCQFVPFLANSPCYLPITAPNTQLNTVQFTVTNMTNTSKPVVTLTLAGTAQATTNTPANLTYSRTVTPRILQDPSANAIEDNVVPSINSVELLSNGATIRTLSATTPTNVDRSIVDGTNLELRITANDNAGVHTMRFENRTDLSRGEIVYDEPLSASQSWTTNSLTIVGGLTNTVSVTVLDQSTNSVSGDYEIVVNGVLEPPPPLDAADMFLNQWCTNAPGQVTIGLRNNDPNHLPYNYYACQSALGVNCDPKANPDITRTNQNFVNQGWTNQPVGFRYCATMVPVRGGVEATTYDFLCQDFTDVLPCTVGGNEWNINFNPTVATVNLVQQQPGSLYSVNQRPITITKANGTDAAPASITCSLSNILTGGTPIPTAITTNVRNNSQFTSTAGGANLIMKVPGNLPLGTLTVAVRCQDTGDASNYVTKNFSLYVTHNSGGTR